MGDQRRGLCGAWRWEVIAGNLEQKAPGRTRALISDLIAADPQEWLQNAPWCPGPDIHPVS